MCNWNWNNVIDPKSAPVIRFSEKLSTKCHIKDYYLN